MHDAAFKLVSYCCWNKPFFSFTWLKQHSNIYVNIYVFSNKPVYLLDFEFDMVLA